MISEFPLFVFTLLGGMAAGSYAFTAIFPARELYKPWVRPLIVLALLAVSGLFLLTHLGRPSNVLFAFSNVTSGITVEGITMVLFGITVLVDFALSFRKGESIRPVVIVGAVLGIALLCAMGYAYASLVGVPLWGSWRSCPLFVLGGLALGSSFAALFAEGGFASKRVTACVVAALVAGVAAVALTAVSFFSAGEGSALFAIAVIALVLAVGAAVAGKQSRSYRLAPLVCLLCVVGMAAARYAFYAIM